jgi:tRNA threonylcarbamoyladenosine biosynthesis protein TsaE
MEPSQAHSQADLPQRIVIDLPTVQATQALGRCLAEQLPAGSVLLLKGELGSGKTTLVQGLGDRLGIFEIDSPTFTLISEYTQGKLPLYHIDLYRLSAAEADAMHLETYWEGLEVEPGIVAIEWSQRLSYLPSVAIELTLSYLAEGGRRAELLVPAALGLNLSPDLCD